MNEKFEKEFEKTANNSHTLVFCAECSVNYSGRAESKLPRGDRLIIIKADNTLLIHQPKGNNPINYMKEGGKHTLLNTSEGYEIKSEHIKNKEILRIKIHKLHFHKAHRLIDNEKILTAGTESDMSNMIYENPKIIGDDFKPLSREEHTKYGFIDVFGHDRDNNLIIVECKRSSADLKAVTQLRRYIERIKETKGTNKIKGILASPSITQNAKKMLEDWNYEWKQVNPPRKWKERDEKQKSLSFY